MKYKIKQGDCLMSVASAHGLLIDTIWSHPSNRDIKNKRNNPSALLPGDAIFVPKVKTKTISAGTGAKASFVRKEYIAKLRVQFLLGGDPRENEEYTLKIDGEHKGGKLDAEGYLDINIRPTAKSVKIQFKNEEEMVLDLGALDPCEEASGVQMRLNNLGFFCGDEDGDCGEKTEGAIRRFQESIANGDDSKVTGILDDDTIDALKEAYGA